MKTSMALMMMSLLVACGLCFGNVARADDDGETKQQAAPAKAPSAADTAAQDANLVKDEKKDTTATEAQAIVALQCVTGDCYKDAVSDPCYSIGENGCIRPNGTQNSDSGSSPANANK